jgi:hypothetical protein
MDRTGPAKEVRIITLSAIAGFFAPLCFVAIFAMRKIRRRVNFHFKFWNKRVKAELARWS